VLAAHFTFHESGDGGSNPWLLVLASLVAAVVAAGIAVVGAAPVLADRWPNVFLPVIEAIDRNMLAGLCLAGAALTLVITWALTGPGA
jgi:hypothetical protein